MTLSQNMTWWVSCLSNDYDYDFDLLKKKQKKNFWALHQFNYSHKYNQKYDWMIELVN